MEGQRHVSERSTEVKSERTTRREWELSEKVVELERALASRIERDEIREMEIKSLRSELDLRVAYNTALEQQKAALEQQKASLEQLAQERLELANERLQVAQERLHHIEWLKGHLDHLVSIPALAPVLSEEDARAALVAERQRLSYRIVARLSRHRRMFEGARGIVKVLLPGRG